MVGLIFGNSVYSLFREREQIRGAGIALVRSQSQTPYDGTSGGRAPASMGKSQSALGALKVEQIEIPCALTPFEHSTSSEKIRLQGTLCSSASKSVNLRAKGGATRVPAQLNEEDRAFEFAEEWSLHPGHNDFILETTLSSGKKIQREVTILKK